jgi:hypothetical protein
MTLLIKDALDCASNLEWRLARGNTAIRALKWLTQDDLLKNAQLHLASQWGVVRRGRRQQGCPRLSQQGA